MSSPLLVAGTAAVVLLGDQCAKFWARTHLLPGCSLPFIPGFLRLMLVTNTGGAFSLARGNNGLLAGLAMVFIMAILSWAVARERSSNRPGWVERLGLGCLLGGALGNLVDRLMQGQVTDFLDFVFISFPVFNIADVCIDIGLLLMMSASWVNKCPPDRQGQPKPRAKSAPH